MVRRSMYPTPERKPNPPRSWVSDLWRSRDKTDQTRPFDWGRGLAAAGSIGSLRFARAVGSIGTKFLKWFNRDSEAGERQSQWRWTQQGRGDLVDAIESIHSASPWVEAQALSIDATGKHLHLYNLFVSEGTEPTAAIADWAEKLRGMGVKTVEVVRVGVRGPTGVISESAQARASLEAVFPRPAITSPSSDFGPRFASSKRAPIAAAPPLFRDFPGSPGRATIPLREPPSRSIAPGGGRQSQWHWTLQGRGDLVDTIDNIYNASPLVEAQGLSIDATGLHVHVHQLFVAGGTEVVATIEQWAEAVKQMGVSTVEVARVGVRGPNELIDESPQTRNALEAKFRT